MFTSITNRSKFGATYEWAVLSVLPMDADKDRHGLRVSEVNQALGMPKEARTTATLLLEAYGSGGTDQAVMSTSPRQAPVHHLQAGDATPQAGAPSTDALGSVTPVPVVAVAQCPAAPPPPGGLKRHGSL